MKNKQIKKNLEILYGLRCMLTNLESKLTVHHLNKVEDKGKTNFYNCVLLNKEIHEWIHNDLERNDIELYELLNECIDLYKQCIIMEEKDLIKEYEEEIMPKMKERIKRK